MIILFFSPSLKRLPNILAYVIELNASFAIAGSVNLLSRLPEYKKFVEYLIKKHYKLNID